MTTNILVMSAGSIPGAAVISALREQQEVPVRVIAADMTSLSAGFLLADANHLVPSAADPTFVATVLDICRREKVSLIFPIIDEELQVFADSTAEFARDGVRVITNPADTVRLAKDKAATARRCVELGILSPTTILQSELGAAQLPPFPLIIKPRAGRGSVGVHIVKDRRELDFHLERSSDCVVQQLISGREYTIDVLTDLAGTLLSVVPKERLVVKSGMQTKGRTVSDPALIQYAAELVTKFRLHPRGNIQCIRDAQGDIWLIEINPKFPASLPFTVAAGVNAPLTLLKLHLGMPVAPMLGQFKDGLTMLRIWRELYLQT